MAILNLGGSPVSTGNPLPVALPSGGTTTSQPVADLTSIATQTITAADSTSAVASQFNSQAVVTGTASAGSCATFALATCETIHVQITGTWVGALVSEFSIDSGVHWIRQSVRVSGTATATSTFTANLVGVGGVAGKTHYRVRASSLSSGSATVFVTESLNPLVHYVVNALTLTDGTSSILAAIKAASTAAAATDPALVVSVSPNSPTPNFAAAQAVTISAAVVLGAGAAAIGTVGVTALPALPAGSNTIGNVGINGTATVTGTVAVSSLPSLPSGANTIGAVGIVGTSTIVGTVGVTSLPALPAGTNAIGTVTVAGMSTPKSSQTSVSTTAVAVPGTALAGRQSIVIKALRSNTATVYVGATGVTAATGYPLDPGETLPGDFSASAGIFAIAASGTQTLATLEGA